MLNVSDLFKEYSALSTREIELKAVINSVEYLNDSVVSIEIEDSILSEEDLSVGECISSTLMLKLYDTKFIAENAEILIYIRLNGISGYTEWVGLGKFYVGRRSNENGIWEFNCNDALVKANQTFVSALSYPALPIDVLEEIATILNVPIATATHTLVSSATFDVPYKDEDATIMEILSYLSGALASSCLISKAGEFTFRVFDSSIKYGVTKSDYVTFKRTNDLKVITKARAVYNKSGEYIDNGTGSDYETLQYYNPWAVVEAGINPYVLSQLNGISYTPCIVDWKGIAYLEVGDFIQVTDKTNMTWNQIESAWKDTTMLWNGESVVTTMIARQKLKLSGGMRAESILSSKSIVKKESVYDGSLTRQIQAVDKSAIKDEIVYNGVSISKTNGITIDSSDDLATISLNALVGIKITTTEDVLYFDLDGNLTLKGNIIMQGGSITWSEITAPAYSDITGTKPPSDADNTTSTIGANRLTKIDSNGIYTGTLTAQQINAISGISLGAGASIDWAYVTAPSYSNVTGTKPPTDADNTVGVIGATRLTYIDGNGIYTGTLTANQVNAVGVTAQRVQTTWNSIVVGDLYRDTNGNAFLNVLEADGSGGVNIRGTGSVEVSNSGGGMVASLASSSGVGVLDLYRSNYAIGVSLNSDNAGGITCGAIGCSSLSTSGSVSAGNLYGTISTAYLSGRVENEIYSYTGAITNLGTTNVSIYGWVSGLAITNNNFFTNGSLTMNQTSAGSTGGTQTYLSGTQISTTTVNYRTLNNSSDAILKDDIMLYDEAIGKSALEAILETPVYRYKRIDEGDRIEIGLIAQKAPDIVVNKGIFTLEEVENLSREEKIKLVDLTQQAYEDNVEQDEDSKPFTSSINTNQVVMLMWKAIQELNAKIEKVVK